MASQVPYSPDPTVAPQLAPTPPGRNVPPPGAFGGLTAAATEHLGQAISQTGSELFERANAMQLMNQQAAADEAASHFQMKSSVLHSEILTKTGKDASESLIPTLNQIEQLRQDGRQGLSPYGQIQYDRDTRRTQGMIMDSAGRHAAQQEKEYIKGGYQARSDAANITALSIPHDEAAYKAALDEKDRIADGMLEQGAFVGGKEQRDNWAAQQKSTLSSNRIEGVARTGDPFVAERMLYQGIADHNIVGQDIANTAIKVHDLQNKGGSALVANRILSGEGSVAGSGPIPLDRAALTIGQYLSKDNYNLIGAAHDGSGQALGRYAVPAEKLSSWLKEADMPDMSAADFLKSHKAQDQLFTSRFGGFQDDTGSFNDAFRKWTEQELTPVTGSGTTEQRQAFGTLKTLGWSDDHAHAAVATLSGESGAHLDTTANQKAGGRRWEDRFEHSDPSNGIANWDNERSKTLEDWTRARGMNPNDRTAQLKFFDYEARQMGFNPAETGDPRALTIKLTGSADSGQGYEKPLINNGSDRWAKYSGQRYAQDPSIQQVNGLLARNTPLEDLLEQGDRAAADLAPHNPLFSLYLNNRIDSMYRHQLAQQKAEEYHNKYIVENVMNNPDEQGRVPTTLEELTRTPEVSQAYDHSSEQEKLRVQSVLANNRLIGGFKFTDDTFNKYISLKAAAIDPNATPQQRQELIDATISDMHIPLKDRQELFGLQQKVYKQEEASPQMAKALRVLGPTLNSIYLDKKDSANYNLFQSELHDALQEHNRFSAKPPSDDDIKEIGRQLLLQKPATGFWRNLPEWAQFGERQRWYQQPLPPEVVDKIKADPKWAQAGIDPTDEMIRTDYIQQEFRQLYSKQQQARR